MERIKQIAEEAEEWAQAFRHNVVASTGFINGAIWADKNQPSPWRSIEDELPEEFGEYLCALRIHCEDVVYYKYEVVLAENGEFFGVDKYFVDSVKYWMPLPKINDGK